MRARTLLMMCALSARAAAQPAPTIVTGNPIGPAPASPGAGLCLASSSSAAPATDFPQAAGTFNTGMNAFLEASSATRVTSVVAGALDLSNHDTAGSMQSQGDFTDAVPGCASGGCDFPWNDTTTSFGSRLRGYVAVAPAVVGHTLHFGAYADDAVSLTLFDGAGTAYPIFTQPPVLGAPTWRMTASVTFQKPGLYALEILYAQIVDHAALELSVLDGTFSDFQTPANQAPVVDLKTAGFTLAAPASFYQDELGAVTACAQCQRSSANQPGNGGCGAGQHCNAAALCSPCDRAAFCGAACVSCGGATPICSGGDGGWACAAAPPDGGALDFAVAPPVDLAGVASPDDFAAVDAGAGTPPGGCGCRVGAGRARSRGAPLLAALLIALALAARRMRDRSG